MLFPLQFSDLSLNCVYKVKSNWKTVKRKYSEYTFLYQRGAVNMSLDYNCLCVNLQNIFQNVFSTSRACWVCQNYFLTFVCSVLWQLFPTSYPIQSLSSALIHLITSSSILLLPSHNTDLQRNSPKGWSQNPDRSSVNTGRKIYVYAHRNTRPW